MRGDEKRAWIEETAALPPTGVCIDWPWSVDGRGYAQVWVSGRVLKVSHLVMEASGRPRPGDRLALHSCDRPRCVAPWHLRWGTQAENLAEMYARQRRVTEQVRDHGGRFALASH